ncbi:MAG TPA: DegV family protein [Flexilinea sp.]|nr:DegV family protein [Flexilinea sp.]
MMRKSVVVTDSAAQVPTEAIDKYGIEVIPLLISFDNKNYLDGIDISAHELYQKMRNDKIVPKTSAPTIMQFYQSFEKHIKEGVSEILFVSLSSKLSSTYNAALDAAKMVREKYHDCEIVIYDSLMATIAQGFLAIEAARRLEEGMPMKNVLTFLDGARKRIGIVAALDTLEYLARGGRIGKAQYILGTAIQILPILGIDQEGIVAPVANLRGKRKVIPTMVSLIKKQIGAYHKARFAVMEADAHERAVDLQKAAMEAFPGNEFPIVEFTPVMGAHTGPGLIGLAYYWE